MASLFFRLLLLWLPVTGANSSAAETSAILQPPEVPAAPIILFDGKNVADLSHFYTWLEKHRYEDPEHVFTVVDNIDGASAIRCSGQTWGGFVTKKEYAKYKLVVEFRWGLVTWGRRKNATRNSGVLLHCQGEDGNNTQDFRSPWIRSIEYEIQEGNMGTVILVGGFDRGTGEKILPRITIPVQPGQRIWDPRGVPKEFVSGQGHLYWYGRDPQWKDVLGFRGPRDPDRPVGEWNLVEAIVDGGRMVFFLNGTKVMEGANSSPTQGRLLFQSEGAEIFFRRIELHPLPR